jgi:dihydropteroate synthase
MIFALPNDRPALMGILNVTPDSFSDGGLYTTTEAAVDKALQMMDEGADLIDVGAESTRPGAQPVSVEEELGRAIPVIEKLTIKQIPVSIDTQKAEVAKQALQAGAQVVNDIGGLRDPAMLELCADAKPYVCIMHMLGTPATMQQNPYYENVVEEVRDFLMRQAEKAIQAGVPKEKVWIDPGFGFGKTLEQNLILLNHLEIFVQTQFPVLVGASRKSFLGKIAATGGQLPVDQRLEASLAFQTIAQVKGARIIRAHDIIAAKRTMNAVAAITAASQ